ncbi:MAG: hypothetical protein ACRDPR_10325, partial [Nocardioidaceae bacterium]
MQTLGVADVGTTAAALGVLQRNIGNAGVQRLLDPEVQRQQHQPGSATTSEEPSPPMSRPAPMSRQPQPLCPAPPGAQDRNFTPAPEAGPPAPTTDDRLLVRRLDVYREVRTLQHHRDELARQDREQAAAVDADRLDPGQAARQHRLTTLATAPLNRRVQELLASVELHREEELDSLPGQLRAAFERRGQEVTLFLLDQNERVANREAERYRGERGAADVRGLRAAAREVAPLQQEVQSIQLRINETRMHGASPAGGYVPPVPREDQTALETTQARFEQMRRAQGALFPILLAAEIDYPALAAARPADLNALISGKTASTLRDIARTRANLRGGELSIWKLPKIVDHTKVILGITGGSMANQLVDDHIAEIRSDETIRNVALAALAIGLAIGAMVATGGLAVVFMVGSAGMSIGSAVGHAQEYMVQSAAHGTAVDAAAAISADEPSLFWLAVDIAGAILDVGAAVRAFSTLRRTAAALGELEAAARTQARALAGEGKLAVSQEEFVSRIMASARRQLGRDASEGLRRTRLLTELTQGTSPRITALLNRDAAAMQRLLREHGNWKHLIESLHAGTPEMQQVARNLGEHRASVVRQLEERFGARPLGGASTE